MTLSPISAIHTPEYLDFLKRTIDAGEKRAITQYFFDAEVYLRFLDRCLVAAYAGGLEPLFCLTKTDLASPQPCPSVGSHVDGWMVVLRQHDAHGLRSCMEQVEEN